MVFVVCRVPCVVCRVPRAVCRVTHPHPTTHAFTEVIGRNVVEKSRGKTKKAKARRLVDGEADAQIKPDDAR